MEDIINFYKAFGRYEQYSEYDIANHIKQSYKNKQYKVFKDSEIYGYVNWAFLNKNAEDVFLKTGIIDDWNCGDTMLHVDFIATKNIKQIMNWLKNNATKDYGVDKEFKWIRLNDKNKVRKVMTVTTRIIGYGRCSKKD